MKSAAVSKLKASLSEYLLKVKAGEEVIVTDRGMPIAKIVPLGRDESKIPLHMLMLEKAGVARIGSGTLTEDFWKMQRPKDIKGHALVNLLREREEGR
ncbi:MAG: type II toxin-antitoxin system prevent-host-death family antitoxin [Deltaproteobacteria bacterium]|nr:type II toxin-antitoxin system prevent-host-death family antitoxin [Deltaproteobacteria bacterium]MCL5792428.1 type II toxin-antitoxin system prevent-host-death family antitoxin [Deltaproteobacteria bacterium]